MHNATPHTGSLLEIPCYANAGARRSERLPPGLSLAVILGLSAGLWALIAEVAIAVLPL